MQTQHWTWVLVFGFLGAPIQAQTTTRVNVSSTGLQSDLNSSRASISADGRFVAFDSSATNLVPGDTNVATDVFVHDRQTGATERVSVDSAGAQGDEDSIHPSISADARFVAFTSLASNLVPGDTNGTWDVFVRDRLSGTTERVSVDSAGLQGNAPSIMPSISAGGRFVAFCSLAGNLVPSDTNSTYDVFVHDRQTGVTERVSVDSAGLQGDGASGNYVASAISADGRYVAFESLANNLVAGDYNHSKDIFVRDRQSGTTECASVSLSGVVGNAYSECPSISSDGRFVAFYSYSANLFAGDNNAIYDVVVRDRQSGTTELVSVDSTGAQGNGGSSYPSISADGRWVVFVSDATNLVPGDTNGIKDVFVHDRQSGRTDRVSVDSAGLQADFGGHGPSISADGRYVVFESESTNLVPGDTNGWVDIFLRNHVLGFASECDPGSGGVSACPCANPPSGSGRGCDNSASTGGAGMVASGSASLAADSQVFTTSGEKPTASSILLQGNSSVTNGVIFGQGVRCTSGALKRLYTKTAVAGSILAPDFGAGDPTVSARSAALGDTILAGQSRWYLVYYRDPIVLGGCPSSSTFNATQTGEVVWSP